MMADGAHQQRPARRAALRLHRWLGLSAGLVLLVMALTGAGMVFRSQIEPLANPHLLGAASCSAPQALPPSRLVAAARRSAPGAGELTAIRLYAAPERSARIRFGDGRWISVDPCSGRVLGSQHLYGGVFGTLAWIHIAGYAPAGNVIAGLTALSVIVLGIAGLVLWRRQVRLPVRAATQRRAPPAAAAGQVAAQAASPPPPEQPGGRTAALAQAARRHRLHRQFGPWAAPVLLLLALTGLPQAFPFLSAALDPPPEVHAAAPGRPMPAPPPAPAPTSAVADEALDSAWRLAIAAPWRQMQLRMPRKPGDAALLELAAAGAPHAYATSLLHFDAATGRVLRREDYAQSSMGRKAYLWGLALHYGAVGGIAWQLALFMTALSVPVLAWTGVMAWAARRRTKRPPPLLDLVLHDKRMVAQDICSFEFVDPRGRKLPPWTAGAHIDVHIADGLVRQYSLCGDRQDRRRYKIAVHRCRPSRGGSLAMHEALQPGQRVKLGMPRNHFPLAEGATHSVLLAGGIGITPILAMAEALAASGASFELHYCVRTRAHAAFAGRFAAPRFEGKVHFYFSEEGSQADLEQLLAAAAPGAHLYVCGPAGFTEAAIAAAQRQAWPPEAVHTERFSATAAGQPGDAPFDLVIASSGQVVHVPAGQTALDALHAANIAVPDSCRQGICSTCVTGVLEGEAEHRDHCLDAQQRAACFTPCCSRARSARLVLDL